MEPDQQRDRTPSVVLQAPEPLGPSPAVREVLYRALALGLVIIIGGILIIITVVSLTAGTGPALPQQTVSPSMTSAPVTTTGLSPTTVPKQSPTVATVDTLPPGSEVAVTVEPKNSAAQIIVRFDGGRGRSQVKSVDVRMARSDGMVVTESLDPQAVSPEILLQGTRGTDTIQVFVTMYTGKVYEIANKSVPFYPRLQ